MSLEYLISLSAKDDPEANASTTAPSTPSPLSVSEARDWDTGDFFSDGNGSAFENVSFFDDSLQSAPLDASPGVCSCWLGWQMPGVHRLLARAPAVHR